MLMRSKDTMSEQEQLRLAEIAKGLELIAELLRVTAGELRKLNNPSNNGKTVTSA